ncbi:MAG: slipin family protein [Candidatus Omnitrophica bacterium]|nr:slipin family protein [Candidatus Omnitrophota bacterium]
MPDMFVPLLAAILLFVFFRVRKITIYQYEKGLKYSWGKFKHIVEPGMYWYAGFFSTITKVDFRPKFVSIPGQEVLSADGITLKLSIAAKFEITDLDTAIHRIANPYEQAFYLVLQLALRGVISSYKIEELLENRNKISEQIVEKAKDKVDELGLKLISAEIKDIMFPGELKKIFTQVARARQEGLAMLEKSRGETASLRNLANSANMLKNNPALMQLRMLHSSGNTLVMGMPASSSPFPIEKESENTQIEQE